MGRKEGGSLFHQMLHQPDLFTLSKRTNKIGGPMDVSFQTRKDYMNWLHQAAEYFKAQGIRKVGDIGSEQIQGYADHMREEGKTASTIHSYLAPLCKATGVPLADIEKPIRHGSGFVRSGGKGPEYGGRPGELNALLGIRKDELRHLTGKDFIERKGVAYVIVRRGKGGKYHEQKVLPHYVEEVKKFFDGSDRKLFRADEFIHGFDYHGQRRAIAKEAYEYYSNRLKAEPGYRNQLYKEVAHQWRRNNKMHKHDMEPFSHFDRPYILRGKNRELAEKQGKDIVLDRLVLRAVSVQHLAHWRDQVTVQSYYFER